MAGRPTKYTPERRELIIRALEVGATHKLACQYAGIDPSTLENWVARYSDFSVALKEAEGRAAFGWLSKIEAAANDGAWQAAAWKLERRYPHEYGRSVTELAGDTPFVRVYIDRDKDDDRSASPGGADVSPLRRVS